MLSAIEEQLCCYLQQIKYRHALLFSVDNKVAMWCCFPHVLLSSVDSRVTIMLLSSIDSLVATRCCLQQIAELPLVSVLIRQQRAMRCSLQQTEQQSRVAIFNRQQRAMPLEDSIQLCVTILNRQYSSHVLLSSVDSRVDTSGYLQIAEYRHVLLSSVDNRVVVCCCLHFSRQQPVLLTSVYSRVVMTVYIGLGLHIFRIF